MKNGLRRLIAFSIVSFLLVDPATASAFSGLPQETSTGLSMLSVHHTTLFEEEALAQLALPYLRNSAKRDKSELFQKEWKAIPTISRSMGKVIGGTFLLWMSELVLSGQSFTANNIDRKINSTWSWLPHVPWWGWLLGGTLVSAFWGYVADRRIEKKKGTRSRAESAFLDLGVLFGLASCLVLAPASVFVMLTAIGAFIIWLNALLEWSMHIISTIPLWVWAAGGIITFVMIAVRQKKIGDLNKSVTEVWERFTNEDPWELARQKRWGRVAVNSGSPEYSLSLLWTIDMAIELERLYGKVEALSRLRNILRNVPQMRVRRSYPWEIIHGASDRNLNDSSRPLTFPHPEEIRIITTIAKATGWQRFSHNTKNAGIHSSPFTRELPGAA